MSPFELIVRAMLAEMSAGEIKARVDAIAALVTAETAAKVLDTNASPD